jgi:ankyrin repeat protein
MTPLMLACERNYKSAAREIASRLPDLEAVDDVGRTALLVSSRFSSLELVQMLVHLGASVKTKDGNGLSVFAHSVFYERYATADYFLTEFGGLFSVHDRDADGNQSLHGVAVAGKANAAKWLIGRGAELDAPGELEITPLMTASQFGTMDVARVLVKAGAEVDLAAELTSLGFAAHEGHRLLVQELLLLGADPSRVGTAQATARQAALLQDHGGVVRLLDAWDSIPAVWVVLSAGHVRRVANSSALKRLPRDLIRMLGSMLF